MKLLFFAPRFHTNQINIIKGLQKKKINIIFNCIYKGKTEDYSLIKPKIIQQSKLSLLLKKIFFINNNILIFFPNITYYYNYLKKINPDFVIIKIYGKTYPYVVAIIAKILKLKIIFYDQYDISLKHLKKKKLSNYLKKFELFFRCFFFKSVVFSPIKSKKIYKKIFYLPFVANAVKKNENTKNILNVLVVSKFQERKRILFAFGVFEKLLNKFDFNVTFVGEVSTGEHLYYYNALLKKVHDSKYKKNYKIIKNVQYKKMKSIYLKNDIFLLPSVREPASISILEAMACGLVVICSNSCATKTYLPVKKNNIFVSNSKDDLIKCLNFYMKNINSLKKNKKINYDYAKSEFNFDKYYQKLSNILKFYE